MLNIKRVIPYTKKEWVNSINDFLTTYDFVNSEELIKLEEKVCSYVNRKYAIAVSSGTSGIFMSLYMIQKEKGEVILSNYGYPSVYNACRVLGLKPVPVDIKKETLSIDPVLVERAINKNTIAVVNIGNNAVVGRDIIELKNICKNNNLVFVEDACSSLLQKFNGSNAGSFGDVSIIGFSPGKPLFSGEGGIILTDDKNLHDKLTTFRYPTIENISLNFSLSPILAAYLLPQFDTINEVIEIRERVHHLYKENGISVFEEEGVTNRYGSIMYLTKNASNVHETLDKYGIGNKYQFYPLIQDDLPICNEVRNSLIDLPFHHNINERQIKSISGIIRTVENECI